MTTTTTTTTVDVFTLSDLDALGLTFAGKKLSDANGLPSLGDHEEFQVVIESSSLVGVARGDVVVNVRGGELEELLASRSLPAMLLVERRKSVDNDDDPTGEFDQTRRRADQCALAKEFPLAIQAYETLVRYRARLSLLRQQLAYSNLAACYVQIGELDKASTNCEVLVRNFPTWPMSYVRESVCLLRMGKVTEAAMSLIRGVERIPGCLPLLTRLRNPAFPTTIKTLGCIYVIENGSTRREVDGETARTISTSQLIAINGHPFDTTRGNPSSLDDRVLLKYAACDSIPSIAAAASSASSSAAPIGTTAGAMERLVTHDDVLFLHGSTFVRANGFYFPQGTRNDRPYYENANGCVLSREAASSGTCAWVLGALDDEDSVRTMLFVASPWAEMKTGGGNNSNNNNMGWVCVVPREGGEGYEYTPPNDPEIAYRVPPLGILLGDAANGETGSSTENSGALEYFDAKTDVLAMLLMVKGHAVRMCENGWGEEGERHLATVVQQALAFASLSESVASAGDLRRLVAQSRNLLRDSAPPSGEATTPTVIIECVGCRIRLENDYLVYEMTMTEPQSSPPPLVEKEEEKKGGCLPCRGARRHPPGKSKMKKATSSSSSSTTISTVSASRQPGATTSIPREEVAVSPLAQNDNEFSIARSSQVIVVRIDPSLKSRDEVVEQIMRWRRQEQV